jgi:hypothetical protein
VNDRLTADCDTSASRATSKEVMLAFMRVFV